MLAVDFTITGNTVADILILIVLLLLAAFLLRRL